MFPYPSGTMHMGHVRNYAISDAVARFYASQGYEVSHPIGFDAFGLPAENAAIQYGVHPSEWTAQNMNTMRKDLESMHNMFDNTSWIATCDPQYYTFEQDIFKRAYREGYIFIKEEYVNFDPVDQTVLSNEQVIDGKGWRSGAVIERRRIPMFFFDIRRYAKELHDGIDGLTEWPNSVKRMQQEWIGYREGEVMPVIIDGIEYDIFIDNPDINAIVFGVNTEWALNRKDSAYQEWISQQGSVSAKHTKGAKHYFYTEHYAVMDGRQIPIVIDAMGHDYTITSSDIINAPCVYEVNIGKRRPGSFIQLHQWCISRQRYWGNPIPMFNCDTHGVVESQGYRKVDIHRTHCDNDMAVCGCKDAQPIQDTMDTFVQSAWYYHYYASKFHGQNNGITDKDSIVDVYIGGIEHATMHLIYTRFFHKMLRDMGYVNADEPIKRLITQGMVCKTYQNPQGQTVSAKMSKSIGNIVAPGPYIDQYGSDAVKMAMIFAAPPDKNFDFEDSAIVGTYRFIQQVERYFTDNWNADIKYTIQECDKVITTMEQHCQRVFTSPVFNINTFIPQLMTSFKTMSRTAFTSDEEKRRYEQRWMKQAWIVMPMTIEKIQAAIKNSMDISMDT